MKSTLPQILLLIFLVNLIACGGGGSSDDGFENESQFKDLCQSPRIGINPFTNQAYPDRQGSTLDENNWLRSWSNNTYLWYNEINYPNPANYNNPIDYFELLKTNEVTASGNPRDKFHFTVPTDEWLEQSSSGIISGFGASWAIVNSTPPRKVVVTYTEPNTTAAENLSRGTEILFVYQADVVNDNDQQSIDLINEALFSPTPNQSYEFVVRDFGAPEDGSEDRTITMAASEITTTPVQNVLTVDTINGTTGYFLFNSHIATSEEGLINAVNQLASENINELVLDLRYNGGGLLAIASQLSYMIAGDTATNNKTFGLLSFNDKHLTTDPVTGATISPTPFYSTSLGFSVQQGQSLPTLDLERVFILSTADTCSASEAIINGLRGIDIDVILIGGTTCGKPYGFYPTDNCGTTYFTLQFSEVNDKGFGDYSDGFSPANATSNIGASIPGCAVNDDFSKSLGDSEEDLLSSALYYIENGSCPVSKKSVANNKNSQKYDKSTGLSLFDSDVYRRYQFLKQNRFNHSANMKK